MVRPPYFLQHNGRMQGMVAKIGRFLFTTKFVVNMVESSVPMVSVQKLVRFCLV